MEKDKSIVLHKLFNGAFIIGEQANALPEDANGQTAFELDNPRQIIMATSPSGNVRIICTEVTVPFDVPRLKKHLSVPKEQVMFSLDESEIDKELLNGYMSDISGIQMPSSAQTAAVAGKGGIII